MAGKSLSKYFFVFVCMMPNHNHSSRLSGTCDKLGRTDVGNLQRMDFLHASISPETLKNMIMSGQCWCQRSGKWPADKTKSSKQVVF